MRLYLPRVEAWLRGITALWFCCKKGNLHTIPCNEQEWDKELAYNRHFTQYINEIIHRSRYTHRSDYGTKIKEDNPTARSLIVPTGLHYWSTRKETTQRKDLHRAPTWAQLRHLHWYHQHLQLSGSICEPRGLNNLTPARLRLFMLMGRKGVMRWSYSKH